MATYSSILAWRIPQRSLEGYSSRKNTGVGISFLRDIFLVRELDPTCHN